MYGIMIAGDDCMEFKDRIKALRNEKNLTQTQLASYLEKGESAVRMWEIARSKPDADTLIKLSQYFECSTDYLLGLSDIRSEKELKTAEIKKGSFEESLEKLPVNVKHDFVDLFNTIIYGFNALSPFPEDFKKEVFSDLNKIIDSLIYDCVKQISIFRLDMERRTERDVIVRQIAIDIKLERQIFKLQCDIMRLVEKIIKGLKNAVNKRFPVHYEKDTILYEQADHIVLSAVRMISDELHMDYDELLDNLKKLE